MITNITDGDIKIEKQMMKDSKAMRTLNNRKKSKVIVRKIKERIYKIVIKPSVMYDSETWVDNGKGTYQKKRIKLESLDSMQGKISNKNDLKSKPKKQAGSTDFSDAHTQMQKKYAYTG